jgi:hypothetical protein
MDGDYRAPAGVTKLATHKDGKDYRFSYVAMLHTHSMASYADVVRQPYFPHEDKAYWVVALAKESPPELTFGIQEENQAF